MTRTLYAFLFVAMVSAAAAQSLDALFDGGARPFPSQGQRVRAESEADWLFMVYIAADNNLDAFGVSDVEEMEQVGSSDDVKITVLLDRSEGWRKARRALILRKPDSGIQSLEPSLSTCDDLGEIDSGDPDTLYDFVQWSTREYPARRVALVIWNHGGGWRQVSFGARGGSQLREICSDDESNSRMYNRDVRLALEKTGVDFDLIALDACLMGMVEVAYEFKDLAPWIVGSEQNIPGDGFNYTPIVRALVDRPAMDGGELGRETIAAYRQFYSNQKQTTLALVESKQLNGLVDALNGLVRSVAAGQKSSARYYRGAFPYQTEIGSARDSAGSISARDSHIDLGQFLSTVSGKSELSSAVREAGQAAQRAYAAAVDASYSNPSSAGTGLAIFFPESADASFYSDYTKKNSRFAQDCLWAQFVRAYVAGEPLDIEPLPASADCSVTIRQVLLSDKTDGLAPAARLSTGKDYWLKARISTRGARSGMSEVFATAICDADGRIQPTTVRFKKYAFADGDFIYSRQMSAPQSGTAFQIAVAHLVFDGPTRVANRAGLKRAFRFGESGLGFDARSRGDDLFSNESLNLAEIEKRYREAIGDVKQKAGQASSSSSPLDSLFSGQAPQGTTPEPSNQETGDTGGGSSALDNLFNH